MVDALPRPLTIPDVMTLRTLADVRDLLRHVPKGTRDKAIWRYAADRLDEAVRDGDVTDLAVALRMVLSMEGIARRPAKRF
jgi:hypothetical protein